MIFNFLLIESARPANEASAARAIKTMGFKHLRLINPCDYLCDEARWLNLPGYTDVHLLHSISNKIIEQSG